MSLKRAVDCIRKYNNFLITSHTNPEGDALGSELAFYLLLKKLGKDATIVNEDGIPLEYNFLPQKFNIKKYFRKSPIPPHPKFQAQGVDLTKRISFDCFVALDCSDLNRTGEVYRMNTPKAPILNIDHHISNQRFGDINWVDPDASSCSEMIYKIYKRLRIPLDRETAILLYVGMLTDTGSFRYTNTSSFTHKAVAELLKYNLDIAQIYKNIYEDITFQDMKFLARILPGMKRFAGGRIAWFEIRRNLLKHKKLSFDLSDTLLGFARAIKGVKVCVLFKENLGAKDEVRVNFRSHGEVDVNSIASFFQGGGHRTASGATICGNIEQIRRRVLAKIKEVL
ncbi:MAG: bifunctional oligoribonuclease/PAP phosphatase NrnA [Candidatus Omnitrophica bacterium]|nr:bifunctional oligoribonuclease/PAP phosphatase NrnA [Candidatus Omnitrophota bacterium]